jgi:hypothetical protein
MKVFSRKCSFLFLIATLVTALFYDTILNRARIDIQFSTNQQSLFQIYWAGVEQPFSEKRVGGTFVYPGKRHYSFFLADLGTISHLRVDPLKAPGQATIARIRISQPGYEPILLDGGSGFDRLRPIGHIASFQVDHEGLVLQSSGVDPSFALDIFPRPANSGKLAMFSWLLLIFSLTWVVATAVFPLISRQNYVPLLLTGACTLVLVMAVTSKRNAHPDEFVHLAASGYYVSNWLPPLADDPAIATSYSPYGVSRLNSTDSYYLFAGKVQRLASWLGLDELVGARLLNLLLLATILVVAISSRTARYIAVPLLVSAQIWYLFSYSNSDAFALFLCFLVGCEIACPASLFNRFLKSSSLTWLVFSSLYLGILLFLLLVAKKNFLIFVVFAAGVLVMRATLAAEIDYRQWRRRLAVVVFLGLALFAARVSVDYALNGLDRGEKIAAQQELRAKTMYRPSTPVDERVFTMALRERGVSLKTMLSEYRWLDQSLKSFFGVYGYFNSQGPDLFYTLTNRLALALALFWGLSLLFRGGMEGWLLCLWLLVCGGGLLGLSVWHSWTADFQPQGRYLLPMIPMLGLAYALRPRVANGAVIAAGVALLYALAVYSFVFYGLQQIPRAVA